MRFKRMTKKEKVTKLDVVIAIVIAGFIILSFVQHYMGVGAFGLVGKSTCTVNEFKNSKQSTGSVCVECQQSGQLAPPCKGTCPDGQSCKLVIDTGICTCV